MRIIYQLENQPISIIIPSQEGLNKLGIDEIVKRRVPKGAEYKIVDDNIIPKDRYFRNAWKLNNDKIVEDLELAKEIQKDYLREQRKPLLENLDVEFMKSLEQNKDTVEITNEKQRLRDITKLCDDCKSCEELRSIKI